MRKIFICAIMIALSCTEKSALDDVEQKQNDEPAPAAETPDLSLSGIAKILSELPIGRENLAEVYDAVSSSSENGYDEEYTMSDLFNAPGSGVGEQVTKAGGKYSRPLRDLFVEYLSNNSTKAGAADVEAYINGLISSDAQIYWPYSEDWDGKTFPIVTFDPGYGAESNYGYEIKLGNDGVRVVDSVIVNEAVAASRPVWVINRNDDSAFTPFDMFTKAQAVKKNSGSGDMLMLETFKMNRNFDSWFAGASEFFVKIGAVDGFKAATDDDLKLYSPAVTDFMIVVKRKDVGKSVPFNTILLSDVTDQMEKVSFLIIEDDGGTTTSWKTSAVVKYESKSYGFELEIPYKDKDDVVWRGQLAMSMFRRDTAVTGRFGDVEIGFRRERYQ